MHRLAPDSGIREGFASSGIRNPSHFCCGIRNPGLWNPEYSSRDPESTNDGNPESKFRLKKSGI